MNSSIAILIPCFNEELTISKVINDFQGALPHAAIYVYDNASTDNTFKAFFKTENFKMIQDDYDVAISSQKISHFINRNKPIQYWVAIEPDSEF